MRYSAFIEMEAENNRLAGQIGFLKKAVDSNNQAYYFLMEYILIEPSDKGSGLLRGVATNGKQLHLVDPIDEKLANIYGLTPGYWQVLKDDDGFMRLARLDDRETECLPYPNWRKPIPTEEASYKTTFDGFAFSRKHSIRNHDGLVRLIRGFPEATAVDLTFLQSLGAGYEWKVEWYGSDKVLKFTEGDRMALIMPLHMD